MRDATVVRRQLTSEVLHGAGLNYFIRARMAHRWGWRDARSRALRRIRATAPRLATRLHNRYPAYTCASPRVRTCVRARKKVWRCVRVSMCIYVCGARKRLLVDIRRWNIRVMRPAKNRTDSLHMESDIVVRIVNVQGDSKIDCRTSIWMFFLLDKNIVRVKMLLQFLSCAFWKIEDFHKLQR